MDNDGFDELRKTLAHAQAILEREFPGVSKNYVEPVVGQETPPDAIVLIPGYGTMSLEILRNEIWRRLNEITSRAISTAKDYNLLIANDRLYGSGVLKAMIETAIRHEDWNYVSIKMVKNGFVVEPVSHSSDNYVCYEAQDGNMEDALEKAVVNLRAHFYEAIKERKQRNA